MLHFCMWCKWLQPDSLDVKRMDQPAEGTAAQGSLSQGWGCCRVFPCSSEEEALQHDGLLLPVVFASWDGSRQERPRSGARL